MLNESAAVLPPQTGTRRGLVLGCSLLAWLCAGFLMSIPPLATQAAVESMGVTDEALKGRWFSWYVAAFLLGAATGGLAFGWIGDRFGRAKALGASILTYSLLAGVCYFVRTPEELLILWYLASTGVGGVWPNGVSLASEALPGMSRPVIAGLFGTTANVGLMIMALFAIWHPITVDSWRWVMLVALSPVVLGFLVLAAVPESPSWLAKRHTGTSGKAPSLMGEVFRPPLLKYTIIGILLGAIPLMGSWGATNWLVPWAKKMQGQIDRTDLHAWAQWMKSSGGAAGSLLGGWMANLCGRRTAYFLISLIALAASSYIFHFLSPLDESFLTWVFIQGFFGTVYFGWLPLYLPELFPTRVRATGTGVAFNWGRVTTAVGALMGGQLIMAYNGDYARVGQITCLIYGLGMIVILFAPDTTNKKLDE